MKEGRIYKFRQQKIENRTANRGKKSNKQCMKARLQHLQWRLKLAEAASRDTCFANFPADLLDSPFRYFVWLIKLTFSLLVIITVHVLKENRTKSDLSLWFRWNRWNYCKFHRFLSPFPSKFPDLNFAPCSLYLLMLHDTRKWHKLWVWVTCARIRVNDSGAGGGYFQKNCLGMCVTLPETLTLFETKIRDFPYPISDLIKSLIPYFSHGAWPEHGTSRYCTHTVGENINRKWSYCLTMKKKHKPDSRLECTSHTLFQPKMVKIDTLFQTKHAKENHTFWRHTYLYSLYKGGDWSF